MLGLSSSYFAFRGKGIYDSVESVFGLGFETAELGAAHRFEPGVWGTVRGIKHDFSDKNFTVHGLFPQLEKRLWFNASLGLTKQNKGIVDWLFKAAQIVEAKVVSIHPGFLNEMGFAFDEKRGFDVIVPKQPLPVGLSWEKFFELVEYACSLSAEIGTKFAIENIHGAEAMPLVFSVKDFEKVFERFPEIGFLFDFGHALFEGKESEFIKAFASKIAEVHMHCSQRKQSQESKDDHAPISSIEKLKLFKAVSQFKEIPIIFEHGTNVSVGEIAAEKSLVERFEESL